VEMFANFLLQKSDFASKNTIFAKIWLDFCKIPQTLSQKLDSAKNFFPIFAIFLLLYNFCKKTCTFLCLQKIRFCCIPIFVKIGVFLWKSAFFAKNT
jgi:hypothetical protein